eukprot:2762485-Amphidinium_carterae.3
MQALIYQGQVCVPNGAGLEHKWADRKLLKTVTEPATMLSGAKMEVIEDIADGALPTSTNIDVAMKFRQSNNGSKTINLWAAYQTFNLRSAKAGPNAMERILEKLLEGIDIGVNTGIIC